MDHASIRFPEENRTVSRRAAFGAAAVGIAALGAGHRPRPSVAQATPEAVPPVVARWAAAWNAQDPAAMAALFTDDGVYEDLAFGASFEGKEGVAEWVGITSSVIPDAAVELVGAFRAGDRATAEWIFTGTQLPAAGIEAQVGRESFSIRVASVFELEGDRIRRVTDYYNPSAAQAQPGAATPTAAPATPLATNSGLWTQWAALWNGNLAPADEIIAPSFVAHFAPVGSSPAEVRGPEGLKGWIGQSLAAFSDYRFETQVGPLADGGMIAGRWLFRGTYRGGIPGAVPDAVGNRVEYAGIDILRVEEGLIVEYWLSADSLSLLLQIGAIPS